jgi:hypothetical protein
MTSVRVPLVVCAFAELSRPPLHGGTCAAGALHGAGDGGAVGRPFIAERVL